MQRGAGKTEYERKYYTFDHWIRTKLNSSGTYLFRITAFVPPDGLSVLRVRDEGHRITFTIKDNQRPYPIENETTVGNYDETVAMLTKLGHKKMYVVEKIREVYTYKSCEVVFDHYPGLPPCIEIEASTEEEVLEAAGELGLVQEEQLLAGDMYEKLYGATKERKLGDLTFDSAEAVFYEHIKKNRDDFDLLLARQRLLIEDIKS